MRRRTAAGRSRRTGRRTRRAELGRTVGFKCHENKCNAGCLTAAASDASGLSAGRRVFVSGNGNGIFLAVVAAAGIAGYAENRRAAACHSARKGRTAVSASYNYVEISLWKSAGGKVVLNSNGYPAHFAVGTAAAVVVIAAAAAIVVIAAIAAHNIHSFRIANFALWCGLRALRGFCTANLCISRALHYMQKVKAVFCRSSVRKDTPVPRVGKLLHNIAVQDFRTLGNAGRSFFHLLKADTVFLP